MVVEDAEKLKQNRNREGNGNKNRMKKNLLQFESS